MFLQVRQSLHIVLVCHEGVAIHELRYIIFIFHIITFLKSLVSFISESVASMSSIVGNWLCMFSGMSLDILLVIVQQVIAHLLRLIWQQLVVKL